MLLLATALILSQFTILGCGQDSDTINSVDTHSIDTNIDDFNTLSNANSLIPSAGKIASVSSFDQHNVISFGNGAMGLLNNMETGLTLTEDGSVLKSRKIAMFSYGSDLMQIGDIQSLSARDTLGNEFSSQSERLVTLENLNLPFALLSEDLTRISGDGIGIEDLSSKNILLLPDTYAADYLDRLTLAFGGPDSIDITTFKYAGGTLDAAGFDDLSKTLHAAGFGNFNLIAFDFSKYLALFFPKEPEDNGYRTITKDGVTVNWRIH
jgi:hypothetical protein